MKTPEPVQKNQPGVKDALSKRPNYSTLQITIKALPWLALHAAAIVVLTLSGRAAL